MELGASTIPEVLEQTADRWPDLAAVVDGDVRISFGELRALAEDFACTLVDGGVSPGDRVAVLGPNSWSWVVAAFGVWRAGAIIAPINTRLRGFEIAQALEHTGAVAWVTVPDFLGTDYLSLVRDQRGGAGPDRPVAELPTLTQVFVMDDRQDVDLPTGPGVVGWGITWPRQDETPRRTPPVAMPAPDDVCEILFTSGTTGVPKGVMLDHAQLLGSYDDWSRLGGLRHGDALLVISPFSHGFGINAGIVACALRGMTLVPMDVFEPGEALELVAEEGITVVSGPPNLFTTLLEHPEFDRRSISSLRVAYLGAASVPGELIRRIGTDMSIERVINAYGLTEGTVVTMTRDDDPDEVIATTVGRPLPDVEVRIVDDVEEEVGVGEAGEVFVRSPGVMRGYWQDERATADAITEHGWLRTGDIGALDRDGNLQLIDRKKEVFIVGGFNTYPAEVENLLLRHPAIAQVAVVGVPDTRLGEVGYAQVVVRHGEGVSGDDVIAWAREAMANYKVPRVVDVVDELPLNPNGKVDKAELRARVERAPETGGMT